MNTGRLLRGLVRHGMRGGRRRGRRRRRGGGGLGGGLARTLGGGAAGGLKGSIGLGALGVAIAAFEHFVADKQSAPSVPGGGGSPAGDPLPSVAPPVPGAGPTGDAPPPPPPPSGSAVAPSPPPAPGSPGGAPELEAAGDEVNLLLIRAMAAAAHADGEVDDAEREAILRTIEEAGCGEEERSFLERCLSEPPSVDELAAAMPSADVAPQLYVAALLAIDVDNDAERDFVRRLRSALALAPEVADELDDQFLTTGDEAANGNPAGGAT